MKLSNHGEDRMSERVGLSAAAAARLAARAFVSGIRQHDTVGELHKFLAALGARHGTTPVIYGEFVFTFARDDTLVTVLSLPNRFRATARKVLARKKDTK